MSKVKECDKRPVSSERRSSCRYSTLSKAFTMISKVFQAGRRRQCVLPPEFFGPTKNHFQIISSHRHLNLTYHHILLPSKTDTSLTAYHEHFPGSDCTNILVEIWGEYFSGILSRAIVRNQPNVARHNNRECISLKYERVFLWLIRRVFLWNMREYFFE